MDALCKCDPGQSMDDSSERDDPILTDIEKEVLQRPDATDSYRTGQVSTVGVATRPPKPSQGCDNDQESSCGGATGRNRPCTQVARKKARGDTLGLARPAYTIGRVALGPIKPRGMDSGLGSSASGEIQT